MGKKSDPSTAAPSAVPANASSLTPPLAAAPPPADVTTDGAPKKAAPPNKAPVKKKPAIAKKTKKKPAAKRVKLSTEDIALRAYFISEHRHKHGIHGDSHSDWIEAERQLKAELKKKKG